MRNSLFLLSSLIFAGSSVLLTTSSRTFGNEESSPPFLKPGHDYVLRFAGVSPFRRTEGIPIEPEYYTKPNAVITSASVTYSIEVFSIVRIFDDTWVQVEHPKSIKDAFKWNRKRYAMAALTPMTVEKLEATDDGKEKLAQLREQANLEIETSTTWINLSHVVAIAEPPTEPQDLQLKMRVNPQN